MTSFKLVRALVLLAMSLVVGHAALLWGRDALLIAVAPSFGEIGIEKHGRLRRWVEHPRGTVRFLPSDEVDPGDHMPREDWYRAGRPDLLAYFSSCVPRPLRRPGSMESSHRVALTKSSSGGWQVSGASGSLATLGGRAVVTLDGAEYDQLIRANRRFLALSATGTSLLTADWNGDEVKAVRVTTLDPPRVGPRTIYTRDYSTAVNFAGIVGDEYWVINRDGRFERREPLGLRFDNVFEADSWNGVNAYLALNGRLRPDRVPLRAVVARPGQELLVRDIVLEPETPFQAAVDAGLGLLASLRPLPLNCYAATQLGAGSVFRLVASHFWEDPYFGQGANLGWLVMTLLVSVVCASVAKRWAKRRAPSSVWTWTVAVLLLGPMGLLWMRLMTPWVAVENGIAVNIESDAWDEPHRFGTEVFA